MDCVLLHYRCVYICIVVNIAHDRETYIKIIGQRDPNRPDFTFAEEPRHVPNPAQYEATSKKEVSMFKAAQRGVGKKERG